MFTFEICKDSDNSYMLNPIGDTDSDPAFNRASMKLPSMDDWRRFLIYCTENEFCCIPLKDKKALLRSKYGKKSISFVLEPDEEINALVPHDELVSLLPLFAIWLQSLNTARYLINQRNKGHDLTRITSATELIESKDLVVSLLKKTPNCSMKLVVNGTPFVMDMTNQSCDTDYPITDLSACKNEDMQGIYNTFANLVQLLRENAETRISVLEKKQNEIEQTLRTKIFSEVMQKLATFVSHGWTFNKAGYFTYTHQINCTHLVISASYLTGESVIDTDDLLSLELPENLRAKFQIPGIITPYKDKIEGVTIVSDSKKPAYHPHYDSQYGLCIGDFAKRPFDEIINLPQALTQINYNSMWGGRANEELNRWIKTIKEMPKNKLDQFVRKARNEDSDVFCKDREYDEEPIPAVPERATITILSPDGASARATVTAAEIINPGMANPQTIVAATHTSPQVIIPPELVIPRARTPNIMEAWTSNPDVEQIGQDMQILTDIINEHNDQFRRDYDGAIEFDQDGNRSRINAGLPPINLAEERSHPATTIRIIPLGGDTDVFETPAPVAHNPIPAHVEDYENDDEVFGSH